MLVILAAVHDVKELHDLVGGSLGSAVGRNSMEESEMIGAIMVVKRRYVST